MFTTKKLRFGLRERLYRRVVDLDPEHGRRVAPALAYYVALGDLFRVV